MRKSSTRDTVRDRASLTPPLAHLVGKALCQVKRPGYTGLTRSSVGIDLENDSKSCMYTTNLRLPALLHSLGSNLSGDVVRQISRAVANGKGEFALWDPPDLLFNVPHRQVLFSLDDQNPPSHTEIRTYQAEFDGLALSRFEIWLFVSPQMSGWLLGLGFWESHILLLSGSLRINLPIGGQQRHLAFLNWSR